MTFEIWGDGGKHSLEYDTLALSWRTGAAVIEA
jgi:hypothetical protein